MTHRFTAFLNDPDAERPDNPIHSSSGGQRHGFKSALVPGVHVFGWTSRAFIESFGEEWSSSGWASVVFRRPVYDGDVMTVNLNRDQFTVTNPDCDVCLEGRVGIGEPAFTIEPVPFSPPSDVASRPALTLDNAPVGEPLPAMSVAWRAERQAEFLESWAGDACQAYIGVREVCHPAWVASQPIDLLHHSYQYGPAIHTNTALQYLSTPLLGQTFTTCGRCVDAFDRRGHHFIVNDCALFDENRNECVRIRHTAIFRLRSAA